MSKTTRERIVWDVLAKYRIYRGDIAREILDALDLPGKVNHAADRQAAAFGRMNYARDRWQVCSGHFSEHSHYAESWEDVWLDAFHKHRYYFQRRATLLQIWDAKL